MNPVNMLTALPTFMLMCALEGEESGSLVLAHTWPTFMQFAKLPATSREDHIGFQADVTREGLDTAVVELRLVRQLTDDAGGVGMITRLSCADFLFDGAPDDLERVELWSHDFPTLDAFRSAVEVSPVFIWTVAQSAVVTTFGREDLAPEDAG